MPVGDELLGRVLSGLGEPIDGGAALVTRNRYPVYADPPNPMMRKIISNPMPLGLRCLESYAAKIRAKVRGNIVLPPGIAGNPEAIFEVNQLPGGDVLSIRLKRSSGVPALDDAIERAIKKSSPLPLPDDPSQFQRNLEIKYRPHDE